MSSLAVIPLSPDAALLLATLASSNIKIVSDSSHSLRDRSASENRLRLNVPGSDPGNGSPESGNLNLWTRGILKGLKEGRSSHRVNKVLKQGEIRGMVLGINVELEFNDAQKKKEKKSII